jgi:hypothetical protein
MEGLMAKTVGISFCFEEHEKMAEGVERLKTLLHSWDIAFENMDDLNVYFTFELPDDERLELHIRAIMDVTRMTTREVHVRFGRSADRSVIGILPERFEECIGQALEWCRRFGDYEITIAD